jgi:hypothetical protein
MIERIGESALNPEIVIRPRFPIGTELWFMLNNKPWLALVAGYNVYVTAHNENEGYVWYHQLFGRWLNRKQKEYWCYNWDYIIKVDTDLSSNNRLTIKNGIPYFMDKRCYFSKEELLKSL